MKLRTLLLVVTASCLVMGLGGWALNRTIGCIFPSSLLNRLPAGSTVSLVEQVLGQPTFVIAEGNGGTGSCWRYERWPNPGYADVQFDARDRVKWINDESVFRDFP